jgi:hypothetical protein
MGMAQVAWTRPNNSPLASTISFSIRNIEGHGRKRKINQENRSQWLSLSLESDE